MKLGDALEMVLDHANKGKAGFRTLGHDMAEFALKTTEDYGIINPVRNAITKGVTGKEGNLPTFLNLMGGGKPDGSEGNPLHVVLGTAKGSAHGGAGGPVAGILRMLGLGPAKRAPGSDPSAGGDNAPVVHQHITVHPDVSSIARGEIMKAMPDIQSSAVKALGDAVSRGFQIGGIG